MEMRLAPSAAAGVEAIKMFLLVMSCSLFFSEPLKKQLKIEIKLKKTKTSKKQIEKIMVFQARVAASIQCHER